MNLLAGSDFLYSLFCSNYVKIGFAQQQNKLFVRHDGISNSAGSVGLHVYGALYTDMCTVESSLFQPNEKAKKVCSTNQDRVQLYHVALKMVHKSKVVVSQGVQEENEQLSNSENGILCIALETHQEVMGRERERERERTVFAFLRQKMHLVVCFL